MTTKPALTLSLNMSISTT